VSGALSAPRPPLIFGQGWRVSHTRVRSLYLLVVVIGAGPNVPPSAPGPQPVLLWRSRVRLPQASHSEGGPESEAYTLFTLELNLSNSITYSYVKLGHTVNR